MSFIKVWLCDGYFKDINSMFDLIVKIFIRFENWIKYVVVIMSNWMLFLFNINLELYVICR